MENFILLNGIYYKKSLIDLANQIATREEAVTLKEAQLFYVDVLDNGFITQTEVRTIRYILSTYAFEEKAKEWLSKKMDQETPTQRAIKGVIKEAVAYPNMKWIISDEEVAAQEAMGGSVPFLTVLFEMLHSFLYQMESSTSPRDVISIELGVDLDDNDVTTTKLRELLDDATLYLFPNNYLELIECKELPFSTPNFTHNVEEYWTFGLLLHAIPNWQFIGFVNRNDDYDTYNTGYQVEIAGAAE